jgi:hypothetical protein
MGVNPDRALIDSIAECARLIPVDGDLRALSREASEQLLQCCLQAWFLMNDLDDQSDLARIFALVYGAIAASDVVPGDSAGQRESAEVLQSLRQELMAELGSLR